MRPTRRVLSRRQVLVGAALALGWAADPFGWVVAEGVGVGIADDAARATLRAYASTLVPGPGDDPAGTPGAVEAGAVDQLEEQVPYVIPFIVADVSASALRRHRRPFAQLDYPAREQLLVEAFADPTRSPYHLIALAVGAGTFYGDFRNRVGGDHLGFPGPSDGYLTTFSDGESHGQPQLDAVPA